MRTSVLQSAFIFAAVLVAAAFQDMAPSFGGAKPPLLLLAVLYWSFTEPRRNKRRSAPPELPYWIPAAVLAGLFEDALSGFPLGCAVGFMVLAGFAARFMRMTVLEMPPARLGFAAAILAAPLHELWLAVWGVVGDVPSPLVRFFASILPAAPAGALLFAVLAFLELHTGFKGAGPEGGLS
ncbi:MAG: hypothetical protein ACI4Q3_07570 [Kiritimatiellia bacterium]